MHIMQSGTITVIGWDHIKEQAEVRPSGYIEELKAHAASETEAGLGFEPEVLQTLRTKWRKLDPGWVELAHNYAVAVAKWVAAGRPVVDEEQFKERLATCRACGEWNKEKENCRICGCPRKKLEWSTEKCPHPSGPRWN